MADSIKKDFADFSTSLATENKDLLPPVKTVRVLFAPFELIAFAAQLRCRHKSRTAVGMLIGYLPLFPGFFGLDCGAGVIRSLRPDGDDAIAACGADRVGAVPRRRESGDRQGAAGAEREREVALAGTPCSEVAPEGQRTRTFLGGFESGWPKQQAALDWL